MFFCFAIGIGAEKVEVDNENAKNVVMAGIKNSLTMTFPSVRVVDELDSIRQIIQSEIKNVKKKKDAQRPKPFNLFILIILIN